MSRFGKILLASATAFPMLPGPAQAQQAPSGTVQDSPSAQTVDSLDEIVVTARRRAESQQDVPISITTLSGEDLAKKGVTDLTQLARQVPSVIIAGASTNPQLLTIGIRGIRQKEGHMFFENSASIVYNQAVIPQPIGVGEQMFDIADVQILKGPQGTLFGRNSTAGALVVTPNLASTDRFSGSAIVSLGSFGMKRFQGVLNVPLTQTMAVRVAGEHRDRDGYMTNQLTGDRWNNVNSEALRGSLTWEPSAAVRSYLTADYVESATAPSAIILVDFLAGGSGNLLGGVAASQRLLAEQRARGTWNFVSETGTGSSRDLLRASACAPGSATPFQQLCQPDDINQTFTMKLWGLNHRAEIDIGNDLTLKNILAFRRYTRSTYQSSWNAASAVGASGPGNMAITQSPDGVDTFSEELNLTGKALGGDLSYSTGAFYLQNQGTESNWSFNGSGSGTSTALNQGLGYMRLKALGLYAQTTLALTRRLNLTAGLRYNRDEKYARRTDISTNVITGAATCNLFAGSSAARLPIDQCELVGDRHWDALTWTGAIDYKLIDDTLVYASVSRGYRSGSFFPRANRASLFAYDPEYVVSYETGVKSEGRLAGRPVRTNLSLYRANVTDMQVPVQDPTTIPLTGFINNAGRAHYQGGEFEMLVRPTNALTINAFASYTAFKFDEYFDGVADLSYQTAPNPISPWVAGGSIDYAIALSGKSELNLRADVTWTSAFVTDNRFPALKGDWPQPASTIVNLRADWSHFLDSPVSLGVFVTNLTNDFYSNGSTCLSGICSIVPSPPRMWGADISVRF